MTLGEEQADEADTLALQDGGLALTIACTWLTILSVREL